MYFVFCILYFVFCVLVISFFFSNILIYSAAKFKIRHPIMSFVWGVSDIMAISKLAAKACTAYKDDAPNGYKFIAEEVDFLQSMINKAAQHFQSTTLSNSDRQEGQKVLGGCQSILGDLYSLVQKYNSLASASTGQDFQRVMLGTENIAALRARLISNATLLNSFIQRFDVLQSPFSTLC